MDIKKGQMWSYDIIMAVVIFTLAIGIFYSLVASSSISTKTQTLSEEGSIVALVTSSGEKQTDVSFIRNDKLNKRRYSRFINQSYDDTKSQLGLTSDFCLHFEDGEGNILNISGKTTYGSPRVNITLDATGETYNCGEI
jgi:hypothetical protein